MRPRFPRLDAPSARVKVPPSGSRKGSAADGKTYGPTRGCLPRMSWASAPRKTARGRVLESVNTSLSLWTSDQRKAISSPLGHPVSSRRRMMSACWTPDPLPRCVSSTRRRRPISARVGKRVFLGRGFRRMVRAGFAARLPHPTAEPRIQRGTGLSDLGPPQPTASRFRYENHFYLFFNKLRLTSAVLSPILAHTLTEDEGE